ncbi:MAG: OB-fold nucleic acid binding domain-containing protein [Candidatus Methanofastidiosia archaeon]
MTNIDVIGKITRVSEIKEFQRRTTGTAGKVMNFDFADETASIRVVVWDEKVEDAKIFQRGDVVRITGGYAKKGLNDNTEINITKRSHIIRDDAEVDVPIEKEERVEIGRLEEGMTNISIVGIVSMISDIREHERDGRLFRVCSLYLKDKTGQTRVSLWNTHTEISEQIATGDIIEICGCYTRMGLNGIEVQTNSYSSINLNPVIERVELPTIESEIKITDISSDDSFFTVRGAISRVDEPRSFVRDDGSQGRVGTIEIYDETGSCNVILWGEKTQLLSNLTPGTRIRIDGGKAREGIEGMEISLGNNGRLTFEIPEAINWGEKSEGLARVLEVKDGAIKAISKEAKFIIKTNKLDFKAGDLIYYQGDVESGDIRANEIKLSEERYSTLDELLHPPKKEIGELIPDELIEITGIVRTINKVKDYLRISVDDGSGQISGYYTGEEEVMCGKEYAVVSRTFDNGLGLEFVSSDIRLLDAAEEAYQILEIIGGEQDEGEY